MKTETAQQIEEIVRIYCDDVRPPRNRQVTLLGRKCSATIQRTFLGYELKMGRKRLTCPDLDTARYLKVFAELGMAEVRIPYDITLTKALLPRLESAYSRLREGQGVSLAADRRLFALVRRKLAACPEPASDGQE